MEYKEINNLLVNTTIELSNPNATNKAFREALFNTEKALKELKKFY